MLIKKVGGTAENQVHLKMYSYRSANEFILNSFKLADRISRVGAFTDFFLK